MRVYRVAGVKDLCYSCYGICSMAYEHIKKQTNQGVYIANASHAKKMLNESFGYELITEYNSVEELAEELNTSVDKLTLIQE